MAFGSGVGKQWIVGALACGVAVAALTIILAASAAPSPGNGASASCDQSCLVERLRATGAQVTGGAPLPSAGALWSNARGYVYMVNDEQVTVYAFADTSAANKASSEVQDGGGQINHSGLFGLFGGSVEQH